MPRTRQGVDTYNEAKASPKSKGKRLSRTTIEHADGGGHLVEHHFDEVGSGMVYHKPEKKAFTDGKSMLAHLSSKFGGVADKDDDGE